MNGDRDPPHPPPQTRRGDHPWRPWGPEDLDGFVAPISDRIATAIIDARDQALTSYPQRGAPISDRDPIEFGQPPDTFRRQAIVARYNPASERFEGGTSDPLRFRWDDAARAVFECWASTYPGHTSRAQPGEGGWTYISRRVGTLRRHDLVYVHRTGSQSGRHPNGHTVPPRSLIGVWAVEQVVSWPDDDWQTRLTDVHCSPLRLFDYPVEIATVRQRSPAIANIGKFRGGAAVFDLDGPDEMLAVARACSLPANIYDHPDLDQLAKDLLGYPTGDLDAHWGRLSSGRWRARENTLTEWEGMDAVARTLAADGWGVSLVHDHPGLGYDMAARWLYDDGSHEDLRIEIKATSRPWPHPVTLTAAQRRVGARDPHWLLATVHNARRQPHLQWWTWTDVENGTVPAL